MSLCSIKNSFPGEISRIIIKQAIQLVSSHLDVIHIRISVAVSKAEARIRCVPPIPAEYQIRFFPVPVTVLRVEVILARVVGIEAKLLVVVYIIIVIPFVYPYPAAQIVGTL